MAILRYWKLWVWLANNDSGVEYIEILINGDDIFAVNPAGAEDKALELATEANNQLEEPHLLGNLSYSYQEILDLS